MKNVHHAKAVRKAQKVENYLIWLTFVVALLAADLDTCAAATAGRSGGDDLIIAAGSKIHAGVGASPEAGTNTLALRCRCEHHYGGMFRRPFLYRATDNSTAPENR